MQLAGSMPRDQSGFSGWAGGDVCVLLPSSSFCQFLAGMLVTQASGSYRQKDKQQRALVQIEVQTDGLAILGPETLQAKDGRIPPSKHGNFIAKPCLTIFQAAACPALRRRRGGLLADFFVHLAMCGGGRNLPMTWARLWSPVGRVHLSQQP